MDIYDNGFTTASLLPAAPIPVDGRQVVDVFNPLTYGNNYNGNKDSDGVINLTFEADGGALTLNLEGYDIDTDHEVAVLVNKVLVGFLTMSPQESLSFTKLEIGADLVIDGTNTLTFANANPSQTWGVTSIFLASPGLKELPFYYDPEFTDDGWVAWQTDHDGFYLGRMDMNTGAFMGVVNKLAIPPISWFETVQAVELIRTPDGVAAIGMTTQGLVYLSATEGRVLEGTQGMTFTAMPKGEVDSLRFICTDPDGRQFLYDDGTLTQLQAKIGVAWQWLNDHEVLTRNSITNATSVYDVETGALTLVTNKAYMQGQAAAFTASNGDQMITLRGDGFRDIFVNDGSGWKLDQHMVSNMWAGEQMFSPEFFEWGGNVWVLGYLSKVNTLDWTTPTAVFIYDVKHDFYTQLTSVGGWKDPEILLLNDGSLAFYADDTSKTLQLFDTITYDTAMKLGFITELYQRYLANNKSLDLDIPVLGTLDVPVIGAASASLPIAPNYETASAAPGGLFQTLAEKAQADGLGHRVAHALARDVDTFVFHKGHRGRG